MANDSLPSKLCAPTRITSGCVFVSLGAFEALNAVHVSLVQFLIRHMRGDWGG
ncbi:hypothetical protein TR70_2118 [Burkholderia pseudomallei]|nr:hypothetical protein BBJ_3153 [Burkholderia pseudomallei NCTC 13178]ALJ71646.1 hypothetical protein TR70_2118 [Burkholderia pseudomallei]KGC51275.1 putative type I restriction-modification system methyltransferase subunit [Burkholderia pseudomallei]KGD52934.1 putative type I restriction-modification system methyltransferase subunit [Burkholderia pseudomallei]